MRIAIAALMHEVNMFSPVKTTLKSCKESYLLFDEDIIKFHKGKETELGGIISAASQENIDLIPTIATYPLPGGKLTTKAYNFLKREFLRRVGDSGKIDGLLLVLHGSMVTESLYDAEGDLLQSLREQIGTEPYIVATLDFHANVSSQMTENTDVVVGYRTCPHIDHRETGEKAIRVLASLIREQEHPTMVLEKIPILIPYATTTTGPMKKLMDTACRIEKEKGIISVSLFQGQYESGKKDLGPSIIIVAENDSSLAKQKAIELKQIWWDLKHEFKFPRISLEKAVELIKTTKNEPLILSDRGDDPCSGAPGDGTTLLSKLIQNNVKKAVVAVIPDPESVQRAIRAGLGSKVTLKIGGKMDKIYSKPVKATGVVTFISGGRYSCQNPVMPGVQIDMGRAVVFRINGIDIILTENRIPPWEPAFLHRFQIKPEEKRVLVIKGCGPRYKEVTHNIVGVDTPGYFQSKLIIRWIKHEQIPLCWNYWEQKNKEKGVKVCNFNKRLQQL